MLSTAIAGAIIAISFSAPPGPVTMETIRRGLRLQAQIHTAEIRRARRSGAPFAVDDAEGERQIFQTPGERALIATVDSANRIRERAV